MTLPPGARDIALARDNGQRPADPIVVSLCGRQDVGNPPVLVVAADHDWRFMAGLQAFVFVKAGVRYVRETLRGLAVPAESIDLWDVDKQQGMTLRPIWDVKGKEWPYRLDLDQRATYRFIRWLEQPWTALDNRTFAT